MRGRSRASRSRGSLQRSAATVNPSPTTVEEFEAIFRDELEQVTLKADVLLVVAAKPGEWHIRLGISGRVFEIGGNVREPFYCWESTAGIAKSLVSPFATPPEDVTRCVRRGLAAVKYASEHSEFTITPAPII